jgi:predicted TIM-barrel fold metal-dependent hydrolase
MNSESVIDTHIHLFDLADPNLRYDWLNPDNPHPILTPEEVGRIAALDYRLAAFLAEAAAGGVSKAVHVQAAVGIEDPVEETKWLQAQADAAGFPMAIVGYADLKAPDLANTLDRHQQASSMFRGIRDFGDGTEYLTDERWIAGVKELGARDLVLSLDCTWERMPFAERLAREVSTIVVLDHMGLPLARDPEYFQQWKRAMTSLASTDNVLCKISEVTMIDHGWNVDRVRPWIEHCLEAFGPDRCFFGTNWPVDRLYVDYPTLIGFYRSVVASLSADERIAVLSGNAERAYRM